MIDGVGLGDGDDGVFDAHQTEHLDVLDGLRHDRIVGGDDDEGHVDAGGARDHGADEFFVTGNVDDSEVHAGDIQVGESQLDGHAALLFLGQTVGVGSGEGFDQRRLAVVNMPSRPDDQMRGATDLIGLF